ncbi:unnamed protein product [Rotaria sp. Silwood2]|nr:unnamed protein product [Rotaria sp. Silwood2]CAF4152422.1 unnamed protein product [Rotaria sp. Silwood2]
MSTRYIRDERRRPSTIAERYNNRDAESVPVSTLAPTKFDTDQEEFAVPLKIFDGTKKTITDISEQSRSYLWLRRIKEIFLQMGTTDEPFVDFDMKVARTDLLTTFDVYLQNDLSKLNKTSNTLSNNSATNDRGLIQKIEESVKQLRNAEAHLTHGTINAGVLKNLHTLTEELIINMRELERSVNNVAVHLKNYPDSTYSLDDVRRVFRALPKEEKSQLKIRQEWDMKNLYSEVFKIAYTRNRLQTAVQQAELKPMKKGNEKPNFANAIWWYSCNEASIYHQINNVLKLENFELLMAYRYYVSDLCKMIEYMYKQEQSQTNKTNVYYLAASIGFDALKQMKKSLDEKKKGQVISIGGFISTTTNLDIAKQYARTQFLPEGNVRVLFKISVVPDKPCAAHAYIGNISFHPEEEEVLFSIGTIFVVDKIDDAGAFVKDQPMRTTTKANASAGEENNFNTVHMTASDIDKTLVDDIRAKVQECSAPQLSVLLARYLIELGEYRSARKYLTSLCSESKLTLKDDPVLASAYNCLGMTYSRQNLHANAIEHYKQALNCQIRLEYSDNNALAEIYNNIGLSYIKLKRMAEAQAIFEEAERIQLREPLTTRAHLASIYANIAYVHYAKRNDYTSVEKSHTYFEKAIRLYQKTTSKITHDAIEKALTKAECYTNYGHLLSIDKDSDAQKFYDDALKLYTNILPDDDPKLMCAHMNIIMEFAHNDNYEKVIELYETITMSDLIDNQAKNLFALEKIVTQEELIILVQIVGVCYINHGDQFFKAIRA